MSVTLPRPPFRADIVGSFHGVKLRPIFPTITARLDFPADHPMLALRNAVRVDRGGQRPHRG